SGIRRVERFGVQDHPSQIAATVDDVPCPQGMPKDEFASLTPLDRLGLWCSIEALRDAGWHGRRGSARIGLVLGTATEWLCAWETDGLQGGTRIYEPHRDAASLAQRLGRRLELDGPAIS